MLWSFAVLEGKDIGGSFWIGTPEALELMEQLFAPKPVIWWNEPPEPLGLEGTLFDFNRFYKGHLCQDAPVDTSTALMPRVEDVAEDWSQPPILFTATSHVTTAPHWWMMEITQTPIRPPLAVPVTAILARAGETTDDD
jgi:hypothetical protein